MLWAHGRAGQKTLQRQLGFDKSDVYSAFNGVVQTMIIKMKGWGEKIIIRAIKRGLYNEQDQILNSNKQ